MKENVIDVLVFLFDNYLNIEADDFHDEHALTCELEEAGFQEVEISKALDWLGDLPSLYEKQLSITQQNPNSVRILTKIENEKLDIECQGFLLSLEQVGLLDTITREIIIESAMLLGIDILHLQAFKRIIGLVILHSPMHDELHFWAEDLIFDDELALH